jgi:hypothetical protein
LNCPDLLTYIVLGFAYVVRSFMLNLIYSFSILVI